MVFPGGFLNKRISIGIPKPCISHSEIRENFSKSSWGAELRQFLCLFVVEGPSLTMTHQTAAGSEFLLALALSVSPSPRFWRWQPGNQSPTFEIHVGFFENYGTPQNPMHVIWVIYFLCERNNLNGRVPFSDTRMLTFPSIHRERQCNERHSFPRPGRPNNETMHAIYNIIQLYTYMWNISCVFVSTVAEFAFLLVSHVLCFFVCLLVLSSFLAT